MVQRGDIVLARFPFTDLSGTKLRPVLTLAPVPGPHQDYLVHVQATTFGIARWGS